MSAGEGPDTQTLVREHLANERTLLSWVRTGVSLISFGLVIERLRAQVSSSIKASGTFGPHRPSSAARRS